MLYAREWKYQANQPMNGMSTMAHLHVHVEARVVHDGQPAGHGQAAITTADTSGGKCSEVNSSLGTRNRWDTVGNSKAL